MPEPMSNVSACEKSNYSRMTGTGIGLTAGSKWTKALLLLLICASISVQPSQAIRGALFRTGRSATFPMASRFVPLLMGSDEEEPLLSMASHPALMVDLRQLIEFSRQNNRLAGIGMPIGEAVEEPPTLVRPVAIKEETKRGQQTPKQFHQLGHQWRSPRLSAFWSMVRKGHPMNGSGQWQ